MQARTDNVNPFEIEPIEVTDEDILADLMYPYPAYPLSSPAGVR